MFKYKKVVIFCLAIFWILTINAYAASEGDTISFDGIVTTMPAVVNENEWEGEDPIDIIESEITESDFFITRGESKIDPEVGAKPDESISQLIARFSNNTTVVGIDVSAHQANIDWQQVANSGVKFAMIRCGFRGYGDSGTLVKDAYFDKNIQEALNNGILVGVYFYSTALNEQEALQEAELTYECIKNYNLKYPVSYDFEEFGVHRTTNLSNDQMHKNAKVFLNYIKSKGYTVSLYGSASPLKDTWKMGTMSDYDVWVAHYYVDKPNYNGTYQIWQYTDNATVPGISTRVDVDVDYEYWNRLKLISSLSVIDGKTYGYDNSGEMMKNKWARTADYKWYYFGSDGAQIPKTNFQDIYGNRYFLNNDYSCVKGWAWFGRNLYFDNDGIMQRNKWMRFDNKWFYFGKDGEQIKKTGFQDIDGNRYFLNSDYSYVTGWQWYGGNAYFDDNGVMQRDKWILFGNKWFYFGKNGIQVKKTGFQDINGNRYFLNSDYSYVTGWQWYGGNAYFDDNGAMQRDKWILFGNKWFYFGKNGIQVKKTGFQDINGNRYFLNSDYSYVTGWQWYGGNAYFDDNGVMQGDKWILFGNKWFYFGKNGIQVKKTGFQNIDNNWYYLNNDYSVVADTELEIDGNIYVFNSNGVCISGK